MSEPWVHIAQLDTRPRCSGGKRKRAWRGCYRSRFVRPCERQLRQYLSPPSVSTGPTRCEPWQREPIVWRSQVLPDVGEMMQCRSFHSCLRFMGPSRRDAASNPVAAALRPDSSTGDWAALLMRAEPWGSQVLCVVHRARLGVGRGLTARTVADRHTERLASGQDLGNAGRMVRKPRESEFGSRGTAEGQANRANSPHCHFGGRVASRPQAWACIDVIVSCLVRARAILAQGS